jgi:HEPN domain-containing protein
MKYAGGTQGFRMTAEEERKRYLQWAEDYRSAAKRALESSSPSKQVVGYLNWHAAELSLKALAIGHGIPTEVRPHDLDNVTRHLLNNSVLSNSDYEYLKPLYARVTGSANDYSEARYPGKDPGYWDRITQDQLKQALDAGSSIQSFVVEKLQKTRM